MLQLNHFVIMIGCTWEGFYIEPSDYWKSRACIMANTQLPGW